MTSSFGVSAKTLESHLRGKHHLLAFQASLLVVPQLKQIRYIPCRILVGRPERDARLGCIPERFLAV
jgi:hypothetical protein